MLKVLYPKDITPTFSQLFHECSFYFGMLLLTKVLVIVMVMMLKLYISVQCQTTKAFETGTDAYEILQWLDGKCVWKSTPVK